MIDYTKLFCCLLLIYLIITLTEWFVHKHIMHNQTLDPGHIRHHKSVYKNMKLDDSEFIEKDIKMGTDHTILITTWSFISFNYIINNLFKYNIKSKYIMTGSLLLGIFYHLLWNKYHRKMHFEANFFVNTNNKFLKWMFINHAIHHLQKGPSKGNFNIVFPGGDWLMGDYHTEVDNTTFCSDENNKINSKDICDHALKFNTIPIDD